MTRARNDDARRQQMRTRPRAKTLTCSSFVAEWQATETQGNAKAKKATADARKKQRKETQKNLPGTFFAFKKTRRKTQKGDLKNRGDDHIQPNKIRSATRRRRVTSVGSGAISALGRLFRLQVGRQARPDDRESTQLEITEIGPLVGELAHPERAAACVVGEIRGNIFFPFPCVCYLIFLKWARLVFNKGKRVLHHKRLPISAKISLFYQAPLEYRGKGRGL
jgi:hypothetical protein